MTTNRKRFYVTEQLGPNISKTPEGFMVCHDVPIARTGVMVYGPDETSLEPGPDGLVRIGRESSDLFDENTIASANGKPVTNEHPDDDVSPDSWRDFSHGHMLNVRRGEGIEDDLLLADLMIISPELMEDINNGKREVSLGYDADFVEVGPGEGKQENILINHVALVDRGRCGPRCAIADKQFEPSGKSNMKMTNKQRLRALDAQKKQRLAAFKDAMKRHRDAETEEEASEAFDEVCDMMDENPDFDSGKGDEDEIHIHMEDPSVTDGTGVNTRFSDDIIDEFITKNDAEHADIFARLEALESALAGQGAAVSDGEDFVDESAVGNAMLDEVPEGLEEEAVKAKDSRYLQNSFRDTVAAAEILSPGIQIPVFDSAAKPELTVKKICGFRRKALDAAAKNPESAGIISRLNGGRTLNTRQMTCDAIRALFNAASLQMADANNNVARRGAKDNFQPASSTPLSLAEINRRNKEFYNGTQN